MPRTNRYSTPPRCFVRVVAGQPPSQEPVQHNAVQQRLQRIVGVQHRLGHPWLRVVRRRQRRLDRRASSSCSRPPGTAGRRMRSTASTEPRQVSLQRLAAQRGSGQPVGVRTPTGRLRAGAPAAARRHRDSRTFGRRAAQIATGQAGIRSPSPATGPAARSAAASSRRPAGPAECRASAPSPPPSSAAGTSTGHHTACSRICASSSAARSAANGSAVSSTACTSVPNFAPVGSVRHRRRHIHGPTAVVDQRDLGDLVVQLD